MKVQIFCVRISHYFAFGTTPETAIAALPRESEKGFLRVPDHVARPPGKDADGKGHYVMHRLPDGITDTWVDEMGGLGWKFPPGTPEEVLHERGATRLYYDPATGKWGEAFVEEDTRAPEDQLDAMFEPFESAVRDVLDALARTDLFDIRDPKVRARLRTLARDTREGFEDITGR